MKEREIAFEAKGINKSFGSTLANVDINLQFEKGMIYGIAGENGSGKSTFLSQVAGIYGSDSGEMFVSGKSYRPHSALDAYENGIAMVVQELGVVDALPANLNINLGKTQKYSRFGVLDINKMNRDIDAVMKKWEFPDVPLNTRCDILDVETRKMIELIRAMTIDPDILLLDEITQALSYNNRAFLHDLIKKLKGLGKTIILITHDLEEMIEITDRIVVLRDGHVVETLESANADPDTIKALMVNRTVTGDYYRTDNSATSTGKTALEAQNLTVPGVLEDLNFELKYGEILTFCGLSDSGIHEIGKAVFGLHKEATGKVLLPEKGKELTSPMDAVKNHIGYLPKDRDSDGLMMGDDIGDNFCMPSYSDLATKAGKLSYGRMEKEASKGIERFNVKANGPRQPINSLSGGNKQKINLGRWLIRDSDILLLDSPTRGVDVGVKAYIYHEIFKAKEEGMAILVISDELPEALGIADRIMVVKNGKIVKEIHRGNDFNENSIIEVMI